MSIDPRVRRLRQSGAFLTMAMVFVLILTSTLLAAMIGLTNVTSAAQGSSLSSYLAFYAAQSGLRYGMVALEGNGSSLPSASFLGTALTYPSATPGCSVAVTFAQTGSGSNYVTYTVKSTASCLAGGATADVFTSKRVLSAQVTASQNPCSKKHCQNATYTYALSPNTWAFN